MPLSKGGSTVESEPGTGGGLEFGATRRQLEDLITSLQAADAASVGADAVVDAVSKAGSMVGLQPGSRSGSELSATRRRLADRSTSSRAGASADAAADGSFQSRFNEGAIQRANSNVISIIGE